VQVTGVEKAEAGSPMTDYINGGIAFVIVAAVMFMVYWSQPPGIGKDK
jgi:hypothetical protein